MEHLKATVRGWEEEDILIKVIVRLTADFLRVITGAGEQWNAIFSVLEENNGLSRNSVPRENIFQVWMLNTNVFGEIKTEIVCH